MQEIRKDTVAEWVSKKRLINEAIEFFMRNPKEFFVIAVASWNDELSGEKGEEQTIIRREMLSMAIGFDFVKFQDKFIQHRGLGPTHKTEFKFIWNVSVKNTDKVNETVLLFQALRKDRKEIMKHI